MAKKQNDGILKLLPLCGLVLCVVAIMMMFLTFVDGDMALLTFSINGFAVTFGGEMSVTALGMSGSLDAVESNAVLIVAFVLILVAALLPLSSYYVQNKTISRVSFFIATLCALAAAICFFLTTSIVAQNVATSLGMESAVDTINEYLSLGVGAIIGGIALCVAALTNAYATFKA